MGIVNDVEKWGNAHNPRILDIFRIALGCFITYKGLDFITNMEDLEMTAAGINIAFAGVALSHYVVFAHILGGPLIAFGLFTRVICIIQIPILIGAVVFVNYPRGFLSLGNHMELEISIVVLAGLVLYTIMGAGRYSLDAKRMKEAEEKAKAQSQAG